MTQEYFDNLGEALVAFHIGRGGRFHNPGHLTYEPYTKSFADIVNGDSKRWTFINNEDEEGNTLPDDEWTLTDSNDHVICEGRDEIEAETGRVSWDGEYDTDYVTRIKNCDENELELIYNSGQHHKLFEEDLLNICCYFLNWNRAESWSLDGKHLKVTTIEGKEFETDIEADEYEEIETEVEDWLDYNDFDEKGRKALAEKVANEF